MEPENNGFQKRTFLFLRDLFSGSMLNFRGVSSISFPAIQGSVGAALWHLDMPGANVCSTFWLGDMDFFKHLATVDGSEIPNN